MRDDSWLKERLDSIWNNNFSDVQRLNNVVIRFKGRWKNKLGHIKLLENKDTEIVINGLFKHDAIPEQLINATIAHELVHYSQGFQSPLPRKYKHPHAGGVVTRELKMRGLGGTLLFEKKFMKRNWKYIYLELTGKRKDSFLTWFFK
jgi:hypothetical protein